MEDLTGKNEPEKKTAKLINADFWKYFAIGMAAAFVLWQALGVTVDFAPRFLAGTPETPEEAEERLNREVLPNEGIELPIIWGDLGARLVEEGVIDREKMAQLYQGRSEAAVLDEFLEDAGETKITMTADNANVLLNVFWAFGLANKNIILEEGPMQNEEYGGAGKFASTGGWTLAQGSAMDHYSTYSLVVLSDEQQAKVERVSQGIYRPCCGNATYFPDCNHGMAMLGLLELMAANNVSEDEMYAVALQVNSYWFPSTYLTLAKYFEAKEVAWKDVEAQEVLGNAYSSATGYSQVLAEVEPAQYRGGGSCGV